MKEVLQMNFTPIIKRLSKDPELSRYPLYIVLMLDGTSPEKAFLMDAVKVTNGSISPLCFEYDAEPEPDPFLDMGEDVEDVNMGIQKPLSPEAEVYDGSDFLLSYHLNRTKDGLVDLSGDEKHDLPILFFNIGEVRIKVEGNPLEHDNYLIYTINTPSRAKRKDDIAASMAAFLTSPKVVAEVKALQEEYQQYTASHKDGNLC